jgi:eukaryotic-like serine/threonine-protein kinase
MPIARGTRFACYEVTGELGAGGMGEVYRARDVRLQREVALKLLPSHLTSDKERLARFEREARVLAALSHPSIAAIHGIEECATEAGGRMPVLVLELVEGQTLQERIARGPLPLAEARSLALQIAEGLEAAHDKGIVHRDLKPANVKVTPDGAVKILDFGLAKAIDAEAVQSSTSGPFPSTANASSSRRVARRSRRGHQTAARSSTARMAP